MCHTWRHPSPKYKEFASDLLNKIPNDIRFINITGGEPFIRSDLEQIAQTALKKTKRVVISTNGYFTAKIINFAEKFYNKIGFRISIEGLPSANDRLRGLKNGFDHGLRTLLALKNMGIKDLGFGITVSDNNAQDMIELYHLAKAMNLEFATAATHNSFYFHKHDNRFQNPELVAGEFERIAADLMKTSKPKNWFRAYFNMGLANKIRGGKRPLPCQVGSDVFFLDPFGNIMPCNGSDKPMIMGNLKNETFDEIWNGSKAKKIRDQVKACDKHCWMIGSASPAMKKKLWIPAKWVLKNKLQSLIYSNSKFCIDAVN
jgi:MoaA/NifB/PqqE/SkfB family radical SAM enzyme